LQVRGTFFAYFFCFFVKQKINTIIFEFLSVPFININARDLKARSALIYACKDGHFEIVQFLCKFEQIDVNLQDQFNWTSLIFAAKSGFKKIVEILLQHITIDVNLLTTFGWNALLHSIQTGHHEVVNLLLKIENINVNMQDELGIIQNFFIFFLEKTQNIFCIFSLTVFALYHCRISKQIFLLVAIISLL
jgi:ankyrin repeat protein